MFLAEKKNNVGNSTSFKIGGKTFKANEVTRNYKTGSEIATEQVHGVANKSASLQKPIANAYDTSTVGIRNNVEQAPQQSVSAIKTADVPQRGYEPSPMPKPVVSQSVSPRTATAEVRGANVQLPSVMANAKTGSAIATEKVQNVTGKMVDLYKLPVSTQVMGKSPIINNVKIGGENASFLDAVKTKFNKDFSVNGILKTGGRTAILTARSGLQSDDLGTQTVGTAIDASLAGYGVFKTAQMATPFAINGVKNTVTGAVAVGDLAIKTGSIIDSTVMLSSAMQFAPFSKDTLNVLKNQVVQSNIVNNKIIQSGIQSVDTVRANALMVKSQVVTGVQSIKTGVSTGASAIKTGVVFTKNTVTNVTAVVRGVANGTIQAKITRETLLALKNKSVYGISVGAMAVGKGISKGGVIAVKGVVRGTGVVAKGVVLKGIPTAYKGAIGIGSILTMSDDMALQGVGYGLTTADVGLKTGTVGIKATKQAVKTSIKGGKALYNGGRNTVRGVQFIKNNGLKKAWEQARKKGGKLAYEAGKSLVTAIINLIKGLGSKAVVPIIIIICVVVGLISAVNVPMMGVGAIFSGAFVSSDSDDSIDIREYLEANIPVLSSAYINNLASDMNSAVNGGGYEIVRFYANTGSDGVIDTTVAGVTSVFPTDTELANIIQPIFNAILLMEYDLEISDAEAETLLDELFNKLFTVTTVDTLEYCGQDIETGEGTVTYCSSCGKVHAKSDCVDNKTGTHGSYTCSSCCYYWCNGHHHSSGSVATGTYHSWITYCSGCIHKCNGYNYCDGHDVISYTLTIDGLYQLLAEYFTDPMEVLLNNPNRTPEQDEELETLQSYYDICLEYISLVSTAYGGGLTMDDLSGVTFVNGSRTGNQAIIDLAKAQVGQVGGQPYWSWYGFSSRVEWCACFVSWCMNRTGHSEVRYASCASGGVPYFTSNGQWASGGYTDLVAGDVIFFDWNGNGSAQHTGLVIGTDGTYVYTVEGNSGDAVKIKQYSINSSVILGYGLMNY